MAGVLPDNEASVAPSTVTTCRLSVTNSDGHTGDQTTGESHAHTYTHIHSMSMCGKFKLALKGDTQCPVTLSE